MLHLLFLPTHDYSNDLLCKCHPLALMFENKLTKIRIVMKFFFRMTRRLGERDDVESEARHAHEERLERKFSPRRIMSCVKLAANARSSTIYEDTHIAIERNKICVSCYWTNIFLTPPPLSI